jgi:hypothetical protein
MPLAKEQTAKFDFSRKQAMLPVESLAHLAAELRDGGSVCDLFIRHEDPFPTRCPLYLVRQSGPDAKAQSEVVSQLTLSGREERPCRQRHRLFG